MALSSFPLKLCKFSEQRQREKKKRLFLPTQQTGASQSLAASSSLQIKYFALQNEGEEAGRRESENKAVKIKKKGGMSTSFWKSLRPTRAVVFGLGWRDLCRHYPSSFLNSSKNQPPCPFPSPSVPGSQPSPREEFLI